MELPKDGTYYIVAKNGLFLRKDTGLIRATVQVDGVAFLDRVNSSAQLLLPKLSQELIVRCLLFFRAVYKKHRAEAEVQLHYNLATEEYMLHCPEQKVSAAGVKYDSRERFEGFQLVGTIHSHCGFGAFHSSIDHGDEEHFDGLHITIGHVDQPYFTISCSMMVNGRRFTFEPEDIVIGIKKVDWKQTTVINHRREEVPHIEANLQARKSLIDKFFDFSFGDMNTPGFSYTGTTTHVHQDQFWNIAMPEGQDYRNVGFPRAWLDKVTEFVYPKVAPVASVGNTGMTSFRHLTSASDVRQFEEPGEPAGDGSPIWDRHSGLGL